jgi:hypothetical protein
MKRRTKIVALIAAKVLVTLVAGSVVARAEPGMQSFRSACMSDYHSHCFGILPGGGRILACLNKHYADLKPACAKAVALGSQCVEDYKTLCPDVSPQGPELRACLIRHEDQLSSRCASVLNKK